MRVALLLSLCLFAGCLQVDVEDDEQDGDGSSQSQQCFNGVCRTCTDGVCTGPLEDLRQEAAQRHADVDVQETRDLTTGLTDASWSFWVDANATGHATLRFTAMVLGAAAIRPTGCVEWQRVTPTSSSWGSQGDCGSGANVNIAIEVTGMLEETTLLDWQSLRPGRYTLTMSAPPQPNALVVDIVIDNP